MSVEIFDRYKYQEQVERLEKENSALRKRLEEFAEALSDISETKQNLLKPDGGYQFIIQHYHYTFDTIFSKVEECLHGENYGRS